MDPWLLALAGALIVALVLALFASIRLHLNAQARGDPSGAWAVAGGGQLGPVIASGLLGRGLPGRLEVRIFGKVLWKKTHFDEPDASSEPEITPSDGSERARKRLTDGYARLERWFDPLDLVIFLVQEKRRIRFERVELDLSYSFEDPIVTGKLMGALHMLNGILPSEIVVRQDVSWEFVDRASLALNGRIRLWPGLLLVDATAFVVRSVRIRKRPKAKTGAPEST